MQNERPRAARRRQRNSQAPDVFRRASEVDEPSSRRSSPGKPPSSKAKPAQVVSITEADSARPTPPPGSENAVNGKANAEPFRELPTRPIPKEALPPPSGRTSSPPASKPSVDVKTASSAAMQDNVVALKVPPRAAATVTADKLADEEPKAAGSPMPKILAAVGAVLVLGAAIFFLRSGTPAEPAPAPVAEQTAAEQAPAEQGPAEQAAAQNSAPPAPETGAAPAPPPSTMEATAPPEQAEQATDAPTDKDKKKKKKKGKTASGQPATTKPPATAAAATTTTTPPPAGSTPAFTFTFK